MIQIYYVNISGIDKRLYEKFYVQAVPERKVIAACYRCKEDSVRCVVADALLRYAIKGTLPEQEIIIEKNAFGKPFLKTTQQFYYNISHSGCWAVIAFGNSEVGIDVEEMRMDVVKEKIAKHYFAVDERNYVFQTKDKLTQRFFEIWTAKESYLKYLGVGFAKSMDCFSVLTMEQPLFFQTFLEGGYYISLCAKETNLEMKHITVEELLL